MICYEGEKRMPTYITKTHRAPPLPMQPNVASLPNPKNPTQTTLQVVTCRIGTQAYGIPVGHVREIVRLPALLEVAGAPASCCGMLQLRGGFIPVLDGRLLVAIPPSYHLNNQIIVIGKTRAEMGLLVDQVHDVRILPITEWTPFTNASASPVLQGIMTSNGDAILLFDLDYLKQLMPIG
jgi:chemotaxis signal transduction protein